MRYEHVYCFSIFTLLTFVSLIYLNGTSLASPSLKNNPIHPPKDELAPPLPSKETSTEKLLEDSPLIFFNGIHP
jgi:hypothetical protein